MLAVVALLPMLAAEASAEDLWPDRQEVEQFLKKARITGHRKLGEGVTNPDLRTVSDKEIKDAIDHYVWGWRQKVLLERRRRIVALLAVMPPEAFSGDDR